MKTRAAILEKSKSPLIIDEIEIPRLECGQVLVKIICSGVCGAQINEIDAVKGVDKFLPHLLGHEGGGKVVEIGPGVTHVKAEDHVVLHWRKGQGIQAATPTYLWKSKRVNAGWVTTFSDYSVVSENRVTPIEKDVDFETAALLGCGVTTALGVINNDAQVKIGESLAVIGCGGVGLSIIQAANLVSAYPIIAIDKIDSKLVLAKHYGATHTVNTALEDLSQAITSLVGKNGVDVIIETTGLVRLIELAYKLTASKGKTILVGVPHATEDITIHSLALHFGKVLKGCEGGGTYPTTDIPRYLRLVKAGKLRLDELVTHRFSLSQANEAIEVLRSGLAGRCMIKMDV